MHDRRNDSSPTGHSPVELKIHDLLNFLVTGGDFGVDSEVNTEKLGADLEFGLPACSPHWLLLKGSIKSVELPDEARNNLFCSSVCAFCSSTAKQRYRWRN